MNSDSLEKEVTLEDLPVELLFKILGFLDRKDLLSLTRVSRKLREISRDPFFWEKLEIDPYKQSIDHVTLLSQHCHGLRELKFGSKINRQDSLVRPPQLIKLFGGSEFLEKLSFDQQIYLEDEYVGFIADSFRNLKELTIGRIVTTKGLVHLTRMHWLEKLDLFELEGDQCAKIIANNFKHVKELHIHYVEPSDIDLVAVIEAHKDRLKTLEFCTGDIPIRESTCKKLAECKQLEKLGIAGSKVLTNSSLSSLMELEKVRVLAFYHGDMDPRKVSASALTNFFRKAACLSKLEDLTLEIPTLSYSGLAAIAKNCPNLHHLELRIDGAVIDEEIHSILKNCKKLVSLEFNARWILGHILLDIPRKLPLLKSLTLENSNVPKHTLDRLKKSAPHLFVKVY